MAAVICACVATGMADEGGSTSIWEQRPQHSSQTFGELMTGSDELLEAEPQLVPLPQTALVAGLGLVTAFWIRRRMLKD